MSVFRDPRNERDLASVLSRRVARSPDKPWMVTDGGSCSYGDIETRSGRLARGFARAGVAAGDTVLLMSFRNCRKRRPERYGSSRCAHRA